MTPPDRPLLAALFERLTALGNELHEGLTLRVRLAMAELQSDLEALRRLAIVLLVAGVSALSAMPLLAVALADVLDGCFGLGRWAWLVILAAGLLLLAASLAALAWRGFRRRIRALRQTREELVEDLVWLREWLGRESAATKDDKNVTCD